MGTDSRKRPGCGRYENFLLKVWNTKRGPLRLEVSTVETNRDRDVSTCRDWLWKLSRSRIEIEIMSRIETNRDFRAYIYQDSVEIWFLKLSRQIETPRLRGHLSYFVIQPQVWCSPNLSQNINYQRPTLPEIGEYYVRYLLMLRNKIFKGPKQIEKFLK